MSLTTSDWAPNARIAVFFFLLLKPCISFFNVWTLIYNPGFSILKHTSGIQKEWEVKTKYSPGNNQSRKDEAGDGDVTAPTYDVTPRVCVSASVLICVFVTLCCRLLLLLLLRNAEPRFLFDQTLERCRDETVVSWRRITNKRGVFLVERPKRETFQRVDWRRVWVSRMSLCRRWFRFPPTTCSFGTEL